jgi:ketosteroid isomerase-like protein
VAAKQDNELLLRRGFLAYNAAFRGEDPERFLELVDPAVEWRTATAMMEEVYHGREGVMRWMRDYFEAWEELRVEPEEFIHASDEQVMIPLRLRARGKTSGVDVDMLMHEVMTIRDGLIVERRPFLERGAALRFLGLDE